MLDVVADYHCMQFQGKLMNQTWENDKKPNFGADFGPFGPNVGLQICFAGLTSSSSYTLFQAIMLCNIKKN